MTETTENLVLAQLQLMRADIAKNSEKTAVLAECIVGFRRDLDRQSGRIELLAEAITSMRGDIRAIAIAIDGHSIRLTHIETRLENLELSQRSH